MRKIDMDLDFDDLLNHPVWEFAYGEGGDEIKMKPTMDPPPYDVSQNRFLVRATFQLSNGEKMYGHIKPINIKDTFMGHLSSIDLNAVMFTKYGYIYFWFGTYKPEREKLDTFYKWLGLKPSEIFPIRVKSDVEIINGIDEGVIEGFLYCNKNEVEDFFHMKASEIRVMY
jgi:hypothetical protein